MEMIACQNLAVPAEVMQHVVNVESSRNPFAIGVVGGQLVRQPSNLGEAVATARMLEEKGYNYSLGVAQVNRANLGRFGLETYEKAFEYCPNVVAGSRILAECYASAGGDWGKAFSCYYSGDFTTGYRDGYVQKVFNSMSRGASVAAASAIPLEISRTPVKVVSVGKGVTGVTTDSPAYRVAMRSVVDAALSAAVGPTLAGATSSEAQWQAIPGQVPVTNPALIPEPERATGLIPTDPATAQVLRKIGPSLPRPGAPPAGRIPTDSATAAVMSQIGVSAASPAGNQAATVPTGDSGVFVPQVRGPGDPSPTNVPAPQPSTRPNVDNADLRAGSHDDAFVF
ncbi:transglycosylase SLT domain-containing protein [Luteibacter sp. Lutesp34]|uniref:lytic transglycosylase domain-containing protein n=1 Tax=Luteibacter sp. Lutesp34 TaxID=3243030 RepID=UPI0039B3ECA0